MMGHALAQLKDVIHVHLGIFWYQVVERPPPNQPPLRTVIRNWAARQLRALPAEPQQTTPGQWPESPPSSPIPNIDATVNCPEIDDDDGLQLAGSATQKEKENRQNQAVRATRKYDIPRRPPARLSETTRKHLTRNGRLPLIPDARYWPSWYQLEAKRKSSSLDYPSSEEEWTDDAGDRLPPILVRLSRRGDVYLQARLQQALEDITRLQKQQQKDEGAVTARESQMRILRQTLNSAEAERQNSIETLQQRIRSAETKYRSHLQKQASDHQAVLADQRTVHKNQLNDLIESNLTQLEDLETEYEQKITERDERIKHLESQAKQTPAALAKSEIDERIQFDHSLCAQNLKEELENQKTAHESILAQQSARIRDLETRCEQQGRIQRLVDEIDTKAEVALSAMLKEQVVEYQQKFAVEQNHNLSLSKELQISKFMAARLTDEASIARNNVNNKYSALQNRLESVEKECVEITNLLAQERHTSNEKDEQIAQLNDAIARSTTAATGKDRTQELMKLHEQLRLVQEQHENQIKETDMAIVREAVVKKESQALLQEKLNLSEENRELNDKVLQLLTKPAGLEKVISDHKAQLDELVYQCQEVQSTMEEGQKTIQLITHERDCLQQSNSTLEKSLSSCKREHQSAIALLEEKLANQEMQSRSVQDQHTDVPDVEEGHLQADFSSVVEQIDQLHQLRSELKDVQNQYQETLGINSNINIECKNLQSENKGLKAQCTRYEQALDKKESEILQLQGTLDDFGAFQEQMLAREGELNCMDELQVENKKLKEQARHWKAHYQNDLKNYQDLQKENAILHSRVASKGGAAMTTTTSTTTASTTEEKVNQQLQQERLQRAKAEDKVYRMSKLLGERDKEIFALRSLSTMSKRQVMHEADAKVRTAQSQTAKAEETAEQERTRRALDQADSKLARLEMEERLVLAESHLSAAQKQEEGVSRHHSDLVQARREVVSCQEQDHPLKRKQEELEEWVKRRKGDRE